MSQKQHSEGSPGVQQQAGGDIINVHAGLTGADVETIVKAEIGKAALELTEHAQQLFQERTDAFEQRLLKRVATDPNTVGAFRDPDFQWNLREASHSAARSGNPQDYDLLVEVLAQRSTHESLSRVRLGTKGALESVGLLSESHLMALTVLFYLTLLHPIYEIESYLTEMEACLLALVSQELPSPATVGDLDLTNCVSFSYGGSKIKSLASIILRDGLPHLSRCIEEETANDVRALLTDLPDQSDLSGLVIENPLAVGKYSLSMTPRAVEVQLKQLPFDPPVTVLEAVMEAYDIVMSGKVVHRGAELMAEKFTDYPILQTVANWWDSLSPFRFTAAGTALGYANLRLLQPGINVAPLNEYLN